MDRWRAVQERLAMLQDRIMTGKPSSVEIRSGAADDMGPLLRRQFRRVVEQHVDDTGLIVVVRIPWFEEPPSRALRVRVGRTTEERHVNWRLQASTRTITRWRSRIRLRRSGLTGRAPRLRWIPLTPDTEYLVDIEFHSHQGRERDNFEIELVGQHKKLLFVDDRSRHRTLWYELRDI